MIEESTIKEIEKRIGYVFRDKSLLLQAFTRTSYCNEHKGLGGARYQSNEVLEFFGDSILSSAIVTLFINEYTERYEHGVRTALAEGDFTVIRSRLSDKKNLSARIGELGLGEFLRMGEGDAKLGIANEPSVLEDLFESIIGAVYIDSGMDLARVIKVVSGMLDIKKVIKGGTVAAVPTATRSAKNRLQEWCADKKRRLGAPVYKTVSESGPEHKKLYERAVFIDGVSYAVGSGKNLKEADADAAEAALKILEEGEGRVKKNTAAKPAESVKCSTKAKCEWEVGSVARLKEYAKSQGLLAPTFRDLGESECGKGGVEYRVRCTIAGSDEIGVGPDKTAARECAASRVLKSLGKKKGKGTNDTTRVKKIKRKPNKLTIRKGTK